MFLLCMRIDIAELEWVGTAKNVKNLELFIELSL